ncbi:MAG TPA: SRPBCC family protein [Nocardioides sp.]|nr:SRPBCC family protein [Nocardioides sp.]
MTEFSVTLELPQPPSALFRFLADPRNRPLWQTSLRAVADVDEGEPHRGMQWRDVTKVGIKPWMEITDLTPYRLLSETGTWRGVDGLLTLRFLKIRHGTRLTAEGRLIGHGPFALAAAVSGRWAPETVRKDLLRAAEVVAP